MSTIKEERKQEDREQITIRLPKDGLKRADGFLKELSPLVATRADVLRLVFELGLEEVAAVAKEYARAHAKARG